MEENKPQIIIHKSNWSKQLIIATIGVVIIFSLVLKNPNEKDFIRATIKKITQNIGGEGAVSEVTSKYITDLGGELLALPVERKNFIFFSTFEFSFGGIEISGFGALNQVFIHSINVESFNSYQKEKPYLKIKGWKELPQDAKEFVIKKMEQPKTRFNVENIKEIIIYPSTGKMEWYCKDEIDSWIITYSKLQTGWEFDKLDMDNNEEIQYDRNDPPLTTSEETNGTIYSNDTKGFIDFLIQEEKINNLNTNLIYQNNNIYSYGKDGIFNYKYENGTFISH
jgi:hypothetical protein